MRLARSNEQADQRFERSNDDEATISNDDNEKKANDEQSETTATSTASTSATAPLLRHLQAAARQTSSRQVEHSRLVDALQGPPA